MRLFLSHDFNGSAVMKEKRAVHGNFVYVLASPDGHRKVGYTAKIDRRITQISPALPWPVELEFQLEHALARRIERIAHKILADARSANEWFSCSLERIKNALEMATLCAEHQAANPGKAKTRMERAGGDIRQLDGILATLRERLALLCDEHMEADGVSEAEIARQMGYEAPKLNRMIRGHHRIGAEEAQTIAAYFNTTIAWLSGEVEIREPIPQELQIAIENMLRAGSHLRVVS